MEMQIPLDPQLEAGHSAYVEKAHPSVLGVKILKNPSPLKTHDNKSLQLSAFGVQL